MPRLLTDLRISHGEGTVPKLYRDLARIELLILDDWGLAPIDTARARDLLEIIDDHFGRRLAIFTSQLPVADWHRQLNDPTLTTNRKHCALLMTAYAAGLRASELVWHLGQTVPARRVLDRHRPAVVAMRLEPAKRGGAAVHERIHAPLLLGREPVRPTISITTLAQNVRDLQRRPSDRRSAIGMIHRSGLAGPRKLQQVQRGRRGGCLVVGQMQIAHGRADGAVPEPALNDVQLDPGLKEPGGVAMPQRVDPALVLGCRPPRCLPGRRRPCRL